MANSHTFYDYEHQFTPIAPNLFQRMGGQGMNLTDMRLSGYCSLLVGLLAVPVNANQRQRQFTFKPTTKSVLTSRSRSGHPRTTICSLPREIHRMILEEIEDEPDCISLGLANSYFWGLALPILHNKWASRMAPWAGTEIFILGEKTRTYPYDMISHNQVVALYIQECLSRPEKVQRIYQACRNSDALRWPPTPWSAFQFGDVATTVRCDAAGDFFKCAMRDQTSVRESQLIWRRIEDMKMFEEEDFYPRNESWILRNLTSQEFVRSEAVALKPEYIHGPVIDGIGFGEVLLTQICWSSYKGISWCADPFNVTEGPWAGDRFDITTLSRHLEETRGEEWTDVSEEVVHETYQIWRANYIGQVDLAEKILQIQMGSEFCPPVIPNSRLWSNPPKRYTE